MQNVKMNDLQMSLNADIEENIKEIHMLEESEN